MVTSRWRGAHFCRQNQLVKLCRVFESGEGGGRGEFVFYPPIPLLILNDDNDVFVCVFVCFLVFMWLCVLSSF